MADVIEELKRVLPAYVAYVGNNEPKMRWIAEQMATHLIDQYPALTERVPVEEYIKKMIDFYVLAANLAVK